MRKQFDIRLGVIPYLMVLLLTGCVTYPDHRTSTAVQEREDILLLREDLRRVSGRIEGLELEMDRLQRELSVVQSDQSRAGQGADTRLTAVERRIQEVDRARENDKQEIIDRLTRAIDQMVRSQAAARPARSTARSGYGYEHTVGPGETLSHIAAAYGVTTRVIIEANNLKNPDLLRAGQVLFIPE